MPNFQFGMGLQSNPMDAYNEMNGMVKQSRLAKLMSEGYNAPQEQRSSLLAKIAQIDPQAAQGMDQRFADLDERTATQLKEAAGLALGAWKSGNKPMAQQGYMQAASLMKSKYPWLQLPDQMDDSSAAVFGQLVGEQDNTPAGVREFEYLTNGLTPEQRQQAQLAKLGIAPKPQEGPKYAIKEINGQLFYVPEQPIMGQPQAQQNSPAANAAFDQHIKPLMEREGGYVANDAGAGPTNFGINSRANPDVDVANLTPDAAQQLYKQRYWDAIGGDSLPANLQAGAFDAAVNMGVGKAKELLQASGGDPAKFDQLRLAHYETLARQNPQKYAQYLPSWRKRVQETSAMGGMQETYQDSASGALPAGAIPVPGLPKGAPKPASESEFDRKVRLARELGATDEQIRNMALGTAGPPQVKPPTIQEVKDATSRRLKVPQIANLDRGMKTIEQKLKALENNWIGTGPATGWGVGMTEEGQALETAVGAIQNSLLSLTRVPGIGAQSDLEARIANLQYPTVGNYAENNKMLAENLRSLVADIKAAYESLADADNEILSSRRGAKPQKAAPKPANGGWSIQEVK